jgi:hypothetical protein
MITHKSLTRWCREFLQEVEPVGEEVLEFLPYRTGRKIYDLTLWMEFVGDAVFTRSMFERAPRLPISFLWRPAIRNYFWNMVHRNQLQKLSPESAPASAGLLVRLGTCMTPERIIYDFQAITEVCQMGYWDSREEFLKFGLADLKPSKAWRMKTIEERRARERFAVEMRQKFWSRLGAGADSPIIANFHRKTEES